MTGVVKTGPTNQSCGQSGHTLKNTSEKPGQRVQTEFGFLGWAVLIFAVFSLFFTTCSIMLLGLWSKSVGFEEEGVITLPGEKSEKQSEKLGAIAMIWAEAVWEGESISSPSVVTLRCDWRPGSWRLETKLLRRQEQIRGRD